MGPVAIPTLATSMVVVYAFFRKKIPKVYDTKLVDVLASGSTPISRNLLEASLVTLVAIDVGYLVASLYRIPVSVVICSGAIFLLGIYMASLNGEIVRGERKGLKGLARDINWDIVLFMLSIFLVVQGLTNSGFTQLLASALVSTSSLPSVLGVIVPSIVVTIGASFMNNWPMTILGLMSIQQAATIVTLSVPTFTNLVFSNIIGNNLGPHFFPLGSLAILMWLETMKRKGVNISLKSYLKVGAVLSIVEVVVASVVLWFEVTYLGFSLAI
jgi:arsenical pump membrane protein